MFNKVLVAEDLDSISITVGQALAELSVSEVHHAKYCDDAFLKIIRALHDNAPYDLIISDLSFKTDHRENTLNTGDELIAAVKKVQPNIKTIVFSIEDKSFRIKSLFNNLGINIVYLPSFYLADTQKMQNEQYPILLDAEKNQIVLKPNYAKTFSFSITRDKTVKGPTLDFNSFEVFENEVFRLLVWDNGWKKIEEATAKNNAIHFTKIPDNGLFLLLCKKSNGYERIFRINTSTKQIEWY